jgi:hypothetical protein
LELFGKLLVLALAAGLFWLAVQHRYVFVVRLEGGAARLARGKATPAFLRQVAQSCGEFGVTHGWVGGVRRGRRTALAFSASIPPACRQRLRNLWALEGW